MMDLKSKIIKTTVNMIETGTSIDDITTRRLSESLDIGLGTINFHFKSKEVLLITAIEHILKHEIERFKSLSINNIEEFKLLIKALYDVSLKYEKMIIYMININLKNHETAIIDLLVDLLSNVNVKQTDLKIKVMQILYPLQITGLNVDKYSSYLEIDLRDKTQRDSFIDLLIDQVLIKHI